MVYTKCMNINIYAIIALGLVFGCVGIYFIYRSFHTQGAGAYVTATQNYAPKVVAQEFQELEKAIRLVESVPHVENNKNNIEFQNLPKVASAARSDIQKLTDLNNNETTRAYTIAALKYLALFGEILNASNAYSMLGGELKAPFAQKMQDSYVKLGQVQQEMLTIRSFNSELARMPLK